MEAGGAEFFFGGGLIDFDGGPGVVVDAHDVLALEQFCSADGVVDVHGEVAADTEGGEFEFGDFADEFHVQRQGGIAGVIEIAFGGFDDEAAGQTAVGAVGEGAGMDGAHEFGAAKTEREAAARIQRVRFFNAFFAEAFGDFEIGDDGGAGLFGEGGGVGHVIIVGVGDEDVVGLDFFHVYRFSEIVLGDEGVEEEVFAEDFGGEAGVSVVGDFHIIPLPSIYIALWLQIKFWKSLLKTCSKRLVMYDTTFHDTIILRGKI